MLVSPNIDPHVEISKVRGSGSIVVKFELSVGEPEDILEQNPVGTSVKVAGDRLKRVIADQP